MGDRCFMQIALRRSDLPRFAAHVGTAPAEEWWDQLSEDSEEIVTAEVYESNYAWFDQRQAAAEAGIPFHGIHGEGGNYGPYAFASWNGEHHEAALSHDGELIMTVNEDLEPLDDVQALRDYIAILRRVRSAFDSPHNQQGETYEPIAA